MANAGNTGVVTASELERRYEIAYCERAIVRAKDYLCAGKQSLRDFLRSNKGATLVPGQLVGLQAAVAQAEQELRETRERHEREREAEAASTR